MNTNLLRFAVIMVALCTTAAAQQTAAPAADLRPDSGTVTGDLYTNDYFAFSYKVPAQWTGKAIRRSQAGQPQRFYSLLNALPATPGASIQYMGIQAEDLGATPKTPEQFVAASPLAQPNSAYQSLGAVRSVVLAGHKFARVDYRTKPTVDDPNGL